MAKWIPSYPVDFTPEGDRTNQAIQKHITEIDRIYDMINVLRQNFVGAGFPSSPERNQLFINPNTLEAFTYVGLSGDDDWRTIVTQSKKHTLDNHFSGTMTDLQQLITDAFLLFLSSVPAPADNGKDISINASGSVVMSNANKLHRDNADIHTASAEKTANANHIADDDIHTDSATKTANANHRGDPDIHVTTTDKLHWNVLSGATESRPSSGNWTGRQYFDTTLGKPVWWNGTKWVLSDGSDA